MTSECFVVFGQFQLVAICKPPSCLRILPGSVETSRSTSAGGIMEGLGVRTMNACPLTGMGRVLDCVSLFNVGCAKCVRVCVCWMRVGLMGPGVADLQPFQGLGKAC